jgi:murein DD-endopeptidase MepM/ murein hydrolase activator NlpD
MGVHQPVHAPAGTRPVAVFGRGAPLRADARTAFPLKRPAGLGLAALLYSAAALATPGLADLGREQPTARDLFQAEALRIGPTTRGSRTGLRLVATERAQPIAAAPERPALFLSARLDAGDTLERLLIRAGASPAHAAQAAAAAARAVDLEPGTQVSIQLGRRGPGGGRPVDRVEIVAAMGVRAELLRDGGVLRVSRGAAPIDRTPLRVRGVAGQGLYWSLRAAGVPFDQAAEYLRAIASRIDVGGDVLPADRFDLVIAHRRAATGESRMGPLLYAGLDRAGGKDLQLVKWTVAGRTDWFDGDAGETRSDGMMAPVAGRITSGFGTRIHPILRFARFHSGIDFGAPWGTPIVASADGEVIAAGWAGGYGRQVRIAHGGGIVTTYSHMSSIAAEPGTLVRQGQLIGHVGSSGLSTGPHLHYEVRIGGRPVNPLGVRFETQAIAGPQLDAFKARLRALLSVGTRRG